MGEELPWDVCEPLRPLLNIYYIRHSFRLEKDGKAIDALSEQGKDFAAFQGTKPPAAFTLGVSSTLNRAIQTLEMHALGYRANPFNPKPYRILPPLDLLGSKEIAEMISTPEVKALAATGIPKFKAILNVHGREKCREWGYEFVYPGLWHVCRLLSVPTEGNKGKDPQDPPPNNALIIGHSPFVPMATWLTYDCPRIERFPDWFWEIEEMGGVHIQTTGKRGKDAFRFTRRIQPARRG